MKQRHNSAPNRLYEAWQRSLPAQSLCLVGSFSLISSGLAFAQTESAIDNIVSTVENSQPVAGNIVKKDTVEHIQAVTAPEQAKTQPEFSQRRTKLRQRLNKAKVSQPTEIAKPEPVVRVRPSKPQVAAQPTVKVRNSKPKVEAEATRPIPAIAREKKPKIELATPVKPSSTPEKLPQVAQSSNLRPSATNPTATKPKDYNNAYIDPTDYSAQATPNYEAPNNVVLTERSSGCQAVLGQGQRFSGSTCAKTPVTGYVANANRKATPNWLRKSQNVQLAAVPPVKRVATASTTHTGWRPPGVISKVIARGGTNTSWRRNCVASAGVNKSAFHANRFIPTPSSFTPTTTVSSVPIAPSGGTLSAPMTADNLAPRPSTVAYNIPLATTLPRIAYSGVYGGRVAYNPNGFIFPVSVAAPITSLFGWRVHPITGDRRFHAGTDIGAAMGTPVLAAYSGQVEAANWMGGYGLTVVLNHNNAQQTLYGHMSEIFVQPGQRVEQGTVIGRVGSTGNSTGPHLHFEVRHLTPQGWVAVDPGVQLQYSLTHLVQTLQTAQVNREPER